MHRVTGHVDLLVCSPVRLALRRMYRRHGRRQEQVHGLTWPLRQRLLASASDRLIDVRNAALLAVAYDTLLRRSELVALRVDDLHVEEDGVGSLLVRCGKTDPEAHGDVVNLQADTVTKVRCWLARSGVNDGRLFRSMRRGGGVGDRLDPSQVPRIFKAMATAASLPEETVKRLSGHSTRVGATQDMIAAGIALPAIMHAGRWKTAAMVSRYGERLLARRSGAAQLAKLQGR